MESLSNKNITFEKEMQACQLEFHKNVRLQSSSKDYIEENVDRKKNDEKKPLVDPIETELLYYTSALKELIPCLTEDDDRINFVIWIKKLLRPEYQIRMFQEKRNKYFMMMTLSALNNEAFNILQETPPLGAIPDINKLTENITEKAEWETKSCWEDILTKRKKRSLKCTVHRDHKDCHADHFLDTILDDEFRLILYLTMPHISRFKDPNEQFIAQTWIDMLCCVEDQSCSTMRGIRNDYIMIFYGYVQEQRLAGPFKKIPTYHLYPLAEVVKMGMDCTGIDPASEDVSEFLSIVPLPDEGAFCYIAVTGELVETDSSECVL